MGDGAGHVENSYRQGRLIILKLDEAEHITARLLSEGGLQKHLSKFKICGSIRRRKQEVNDIDIVAIPKPESQYSFGEESLSDFVERHQKTPSEVKLEKFLNGEKSKDSVMEKL